MDEGEAKWMVILILGMFAILAVFKIAEACSSHIGQGGEARRAATTGAVHEHPVGVADGPVKD